MNRTMMVGELIKKLNSFVLIRVLITAVVFLISLNPVFSAPVSSTSLAGNSAPRANLKTTNKIYRNSGERANAATVNSGTATDTYLKARDFFAAGKYSEAIAYANEARKKNRNLALATILIAQSYYRLGDSKKSALFFLSIPTEEIPKEAAIDYLLAMYSVRRYREVIKSYSLISDQHPYKDVAKFYTGVALLQYRLLQKAQLYIRNAKQLPASLKSQRRRLLSEINSALKRERQGQFDQGQQYSYQNQQVYLPPPVAPESYGPPPAGGAPSPVVPKVTAAPAPLKAGTKFSIKPSFTFGQSSTKQDNSGFKLTQTEEKTPQTSIFLGIKFLGKPRSFGAQPSIDLSATPAYSQTDSTSSSSELVADEADPTAVVNKTSKSEASRYSIKQNFSISGTYPVSDPVDVNASYTDSTSEGGGTGGKSKTASNVLSLGGVIENGDYKFDIGYDITQEEDKLAPDSKHGSSTINFEVARDGENSTSSFEIDKTDNDKPERSGDIKSIMNIGLSWSRNFDDFSLNLGLNKSDKTRVPDKAAFKILNQNTLKVEGTYNMSFGISLIASGSYLQFSNIVVRGTDSESMGTGSGKRILATLKITPVSFVSFSASYDVTDRDLTVSDSALSKPLRQSMWSQQIKTSLNLSANYSF